MKKRIDWKRVGVTALFSPLLFMFLVIVLIATPQELKDFYYHPPEDKK